MCQEGHIWPRYSSDLKKFGHSLSNQAPCVLLVSRDKISPPRKAIAAFWNRYDRHVSTGTLFLCRSVKIGVPPFVRCTHSMIIYVLCSLHVPPAFGAQCCPVTCQVVYDGPGQTGSSVICKQSAFVSDSLFAPSVYACKT